MQKCNSVGKVPVWWTAHDELEARTEAFNSLGSQEMSPGGQGNMIFTFEIVFAQIKV